MTTILGKCSIKARMYFYMDEKKMIPHDKMRLAFQSTDKENLYFSRTVLKRPKTTNTLKIGEYIVRSNQENFWSNFSKLKQ